jgi:hypothetical protein
VLVGESPGLKQLAGRLLEAEACDFSVQVGLRGQRCCGRIAEANVEFGDVQFESELCKACEVSRERLEFCRITKLQADVRLKSYAVERDSSLLEVFAMS